MTMPNAGISPGFTIHYQDLEQQARNSEKQTRVAFLAWIATQCSAHALLVPARHVVHTVSVLLPHCDASV